MGAVVNSNIEASWTCYAQQKYDEADSSVLGRVQGAVSTVATCAIQLYKSEPSSH